MLPLQARVNLGAMAMKGVLHIPPKLQHCWSLTIRLFSVLSRTPVGGGSYPSAEKQSVYSTAPADWVCVCVCVHLLTHYLSIYGYIYIYIYIYMCVCVCVNRKKQRIQRVISFIVELFPALDDSVFQLTIIKALCWILWIISNFIF